MKKIMFLYHIKEREYGIIALIEAQIRRDIGDVEIRSNEFYSGIMEAIRFMPDIIVSIPPRDVYSSNYLTMLKIITKAVIISMNTEGYFMLSPSEVQAVTGYNTYAKELVDYYIMWGPKTKEILGKRLLEDGKLTNIDRIKVTGYTWYELSKVNKSYKNNNYYPIIQKWFAEHKNNILVITGFPVADCSIKDYHILGYFGDDKPLNQRTPLEIRQAKESIIAENEFRRKYIDMIISLAECYPDTGIIVKLHPAEIADGVKSYNKLQSYPNILLIKESVPVGVILKSVDCMIHYNSTCNLEAYIYKVPTVQMYDDSKETSYEFIWQLKSDSTYLIHIDDFPKLDMLMKEGVKYRKLESTEKILYDLYNWKEGIPYRPIEKTAYYIANAKAPQRLRYCDAEVAKAIYSKEGQETIDEFIKNVLKKLSKNEMDLKDICAFLRIWNILCIIKRGE